MINDMKSLKLKFGETKTIIEDISQGGEREYIIGENANLTLVLISRHAMSDTEITVRLVAAHSHVSVIGCIIEEKKDVHNLHTMQLHQAPNTTSNLLVKSALFGHAAFSYDGAIRVERQAQKTDAYQKNDNLLLSEFAHAKSKPSLEILANDVRCTHGATTGMLSEDQLWYLASRGISKPAATKLLVEGFFEQAIATISDTIMQQKVRRVLWQTL